MPTLPPPRVRVHYTAGSGSTPPILPSATARSVVVGNAGSLPVAGFRFDGDEPGYLDETQVARLEPEHCTLQSDLSVYSGVRLSGGAATLLPDGARITGLAVINGVYNGVAESNPDGGPYGWPYQSEHKNAWDDSLCVLCVDAEQGGAGLYYMIHDGAIYRWPQTVQAPHLCLAQVRNPDEGDFLIGTPHGVYTRSSNPRDRTSLWQRVGDFARRVTRLSVTYTADETPVAVYWSLVQDKDAGGTVYHGVYRHPPYAAAASSPELEGGWQPVLRAGELVDAAASGPDDLWYIAKADPGNVHHLAFDAGAGTVTDTPLALPTGAQGTHLSVVATSPTVVTAVYCAVAGAPSPLYYTTDTGGWAALADADAAGNLRDPSGSVVGVNKVQSSALTFLGWVSGALTAAAGQYVAAWCCTTSGLFWTDALGNPWRAVASASGLDDVSVGDVAAGQWIALLGGPVTPVNRVFATNSERLYTSHSQTNLWSESAPHTTVGPGPYLSAVIARVTGTLPANNLQTLGGMSTSPIGGLPESHLQIANMLPAGWYWRRVLTTYQELDWQLVNGNVVSAARLVQQPLSDLAAEGSSRVALLTAAERLADTSIAFLGEHSTPRVDLTVQTTFTAQEAAARRLRATMAVPVRYHGAMLARASAGDALATVYVSFDDALFFVKSVKFASSGEGGPGAATCTVALSTNLADDRDASALAGALIEQSRNLHKKHRR